MATIDAGIGTGVSFALSDEQKALRELARELAEGLLLVVQGKGNARADARIDGRHAAPSGSID